MGDAARSSSCRDDDEALARTALRPPILEALLQDPEAPLTCASVAPTPRWTPVRVVARIEDGKFVM